MKYIINKNIILESKALLAGAGVATLGAAYTGKTLYDNTKKMMDKHNSKYETDESNGIYESEGAGAGAAPMIASGSSGGGMANGSLAIPGIASTKKKFPNLETKHKG